MSTHLSHDDPYIAVLYAWTNYGGCNFALAGRLSPTERETLKANITAFEGELAEAETAAKSSGHSDYIELGRRTLQQRLASELLTACYPNETQAEHEARSALERFRRHVADLERPRG